MSAPHTPGPWQVEWPEPESALAMIEGPIVRGPDGHPIAEILSADLGEEVELKYATGDSHLIRAAPELKTVLEELLEELPRHAVARLPELENLIRRAREALAAATGSRP